MRESAVTGVAVVRASSAASRARRDAVARWRAATSTATATVPATATYTVRTTTLYPCSTVRVWNGGTKKKLTSNAAVTAAARAGHMPPATAVATTGTR